MQETQRTIKKKDFEVPDLKIIFEATLEVTKLDRKWICDIRTEEYEVVRREKGHQGRVRSHLKGV